MSWASRAPWINPTLESGARALAHPSEVRYYSGAGHLPCEADVLTELTTGLEERQPMSISNASWSLAQGAPWRENLCAGHQVQHFPCVSKLNPDNCIA